MWNGMESDVSDQLMDKLENFTYLIYASKSDTMKVNDSRYHLFCVKRGELESHKLLSCRLLNQARTMG